MHGASDIDRIAPTIRSDRNVDPLVKLRTPSCSGIFVSEFFARLLVDVNTFGARRAAASIHATWVSVGSSMLPLVS